MWGSSPTVREGVFSDAIGALPDGWGYCPVRHETAQMKTAQRFGRAILTKLRCLTI